MVQRNFRLEDVKNLKRQSEKASSAEIKLFFLGGK